MRLWSVNEEVEVVEEAPRPKKKTRDLAQRPDAPERRFTMTREDWKGVFWVALILLVLLLVSLRGVLS